MFRDGIEMVDYKELSPSHVSAIIEMALSDHVSFADIRLQYGLNEREVVTLMRKSLKSGSYIAWRKRVAAFSKRREHYK